MPLAPDLMTLVRANVRRHQRSYLRMTRCAHVVSAVAAAAFALPVRAQRMELGAMTAFALPADRGGFGAVQAVDVDASGRFLLLGGPTKQQLLLYDAGRRLLGGALELGARGNLAGPVAVAFDAVGGALVADRQSPRMARVTVRGDAPSIDTVVTVGLSLVTAMCRAGEDVYVSGFSSPVKLSAVVQVVGRAGVKRAFGAPLGNPELFGNVAINTGPIACARDSLIIATSSLSGVVRAFSRRGAEVWRTNLRPFAAIVLERPSPSEMRYGYPADSVWDTITSAFVASTEVVAVQVTRWHGSPAAGSLVGRRTVYLSVADGKQLSTQTDVPIVLSARAGKLVVALDEGRTKVAVASFTLRPR